MTVPVVVITAPRAQRVGQQVADVFGDAARVVLVHWGDVTAPRSQDERPAPV